MRSWLSGSVRRSTVVASAVIGAAVVSVGLLAGCGDSDSSSSDSGTSTSMTGDMAGMAGMGGGSSVASESNSSSAHNDADVMFASMMIPHHLQAVEMSEILLGKQGVDSRVAALATKIKSDQAPEIVTMQRWLSDWGVAASGSATPEGSAASSAMAGMDGGTDHQMAGGMSADDMNALRNAQGNDAAKLYLTQMITHHQGAIDMARTELTSGENTDAKALAQSIVTSQQAQIDQMRSLLQTL